MAVLARWLRIAPTATTVDQQAYLKGEEPLIGQSIKEIEMSRDKKDRPRTAESGDAQLRHDAQRQEASPPDQLPPGTAFEDWVAYWQPITRQWPPLDAEGIAAVAAIVARIDRRRADATDDDDPQISGAE
ncbi:hypothetical protein [Nocardia sp. NPDC058114]|uniref:hypothetical protein n=1 Tax=Nocardia sp. NPDC058114 TaxID=3346346 RepID=UPI0036DA32D1